jgi:peptidoglycan/xylan/chitin deacetylase (PgdA/CDA1 family)
MFVAMANGSLSVDDFSLEQSSYSVNSGRTPTVSIMADDNWSNFKTNALPIMDQYGYKATFYIQTGRLGEAWTLNADD